MMATPKIPFKSRLLRLCTGGKPNASEGAKRSAQMAAHIPNSKRLSAPRCHSSRNANAMVHKAAPSAGKLLLNSRKLSQEAAAKNTIMTATNAVCDCGIQRSIVEIRPVGIGEIQFGISKLPEQKVGNAFFSAGTNEQIRFRCICHRQMRLQLLFGELRLARMSAD